MRAGGRVPSVVAAMQSPSLALYDDGRVLTAVKETALQEVPARYELARITPAAVRDVVAAARKSGLLDPGTDFGTPRMPDLATTTVAAGGSTVRVYALDGRFDDRLTAPQREARAALRGLLGQAEALAAGAPRTPWLPDLVLVREVPPGRNTGPATVVWPGAPLSDLPAGELRGAGAGAVYAAALENPGGRWLVDGVTRVLAVNPLPVL